MIRAGAGTCTPDPNFDQNVAGAKAAGMNWGAYHCFGGKTVPHALAEAEFFLSRLQGKHPTFPVALSLEEPSLLLAGKESLTDAAVAFLSKVQSAGYYPMVYASPHWLTDYLDFQKLRRFDIWLAQQGPAITFQEAPVGLWQYTSAGRVNGIDGDVGRSRAFKDYPAVIRGGK